MSDPVARSWRITRRTLGAGLLGLAAAIGLNAWPRGKEAELDALGARADASDLRIIGERLSATSPWPKDEVEAALSARLASGGYDAAVARDRRSGALTAVEGWLIPETQALAALWLASA
jgi:hypothetical protein